MKSRQVNFRLTEEFFARLKDLAKKENRTISNFIETYVPELIDQKTREREND